MRLKLTALSDSFERLVDRLLDSPRYGERWGRYWLDVARYADTKGYILFQDANYHWAYTYRDYVIRAFNQDLPYDRFLIEQIAADRLPGVDGRKPLEALGFLSLGSRFMGNVHDIIDDRIDVVCRGLMSLTVTCARCHDHKFDPIPAQDYYSLYGVLASAREPDILPEAERPEQTPAYARFVKELESRQRKLSEFVALKHRALVESSKERVAEYLLAAQKALDQPTTEEFMLLADGNDLNPTMVIRWQSYLTRMRKTRDPVFALWHALANLPEKSFAKDAARLITNHALAVESGDPDLSRASQSCRSARSFPPGGPVRSRRLLRHTGGCSMPLSDSGRNGYAAPRSMDGSPGLFRIRRWSRCVRCFMDRTARRRS